MERDELIVMLRRRGRTQAQIARRLGMTQQGVAKALSRLPKAGRDPRACAVTAAVTAPVPRCPTERARVVRRGQLVRGRPAPEEMK